LSSDVSGIPGIPGIPGILESLCHQNIIQSNRPIVKKINSGTIFRINDKNFILTCYHCINNSYDNTWILANNKYKCSVVCTAPELELGILSIDDKLPYHIYDELECSFLNLKDQKLTIEMTNIDKYLNSGKCSKINMTCTFQDIVQSGHLSLNIPKMPFIRITLNKKINDISQLSGMSGSVIKSKRGKIIGIISSVIDTYIYVVPSIIIKRFIDEFKINNHFKGICPLAIKYSPCMFDPHELKSKSIYGILITNNYGIKNNLLKNDVIVQINEKSIDKYSRIYDFNTKSLIDFNVYIMLNFQYGSQIPLKIARLKKGSTTIYKEKDIILDARTLNSLKYIPIESNKKIYEFANMKFIELSEDIINYYIDSEIITCKSIGDKYIDTPYRNANNYVVIMFDIDKTQLYLEIKETVTDIGLPITPIKDKQFSFTVIKKINNNIINSIEDVIRNTSNIDDVIINAKIHDYGKLNIVVRNNNITNIVKRK